MRKSVRRLAPALLIALSLGVAVPGSAQAPPNPPCDGSGCFTTPLAASGNGSCFVTFCFNYNPTGPSVTITSFQKVTATNCSALEDSSGNPTPAFLEALEKEAIRIAIQRCTGCIPSGTRFFTSVDPKCFRQTSTSTPTWLPCGGTCTTTYAVTCRQDDPYSWIWGGKWGAASSDKCETLPSPCDTSIPLCQWP